MRRITGLAAILATIALAACAEAPTPIPSGPTLPASNQPTVATSPGATDAPPATPRPTLDPALTRGVTVSCGDGLEFPAEALVGEGSAGAELEPDGQALGQFLFGPDGLGLGLPQTGWRRVLKGTASSLFVAPGPATGDARWVMVSLMNVAGEWTQDTAGACQMTVALPDAGIGPASWWLDPAAGPPPADAMAVSAFVLERSCAGGQSPAGRILAPATRFGDEAISVLVAIRKRPGDQDCSGNMPFATRIELGQPLGGRALFDAGEFPPRDATIVPE